MTNKTGRINRHTPLPITAEVERQMLSMWDAGLDTRAMQAEFMIHESHLANALPRLLERRRQDAAWDNVA